VRPWAFPNLVLGLGRPAVLSPSNPVIGESAGTRPAPAGGRPDHEPPTFELFVDNYTDTEYHVLAGVDVTDDSVLEIDVNELDELALVMSGEEIDGFCGSMDELGERLADVLDEHLDVRYLFGDEP